MRELAVFSGIVLLLAAAPATVAEDIAQQQTRTVVFEAFHGPLSANCRTAGRIIDILAKQYQDEGESVLFLEHDVDSPDMGRLARWAASGGSGVIPLPFVMTDSGYRWSFGPEGYRSVYARMVNESLERPAEAIIEAYYDRTQDSLRVLVDVVNESEFVLAGFNDAAVWALVYEEKRVFHTSRFVRGFVSEAIEPALRPGSRDSYVLELDDVPVANWEKAHVVVLVDYIADSDGGYDILQAVEAVPGVAAATNTPSAPSPTATPTAHPAGTFTPTPDSTAATPDSTAPTPTSVPTTEGTAHPSATPGYRDLYLPRLVDES